MISKKVKIRVKAKKILSSNQIIILGTSQKISKLSLEIKARKNQESKVNQNKISKESLEKKKDSKEKSKIKKGLKKTLQKILSSKARKVSQVSSSLNSKLRN